MRSNRWLFGVLGLLATWHAAAAPVIAQSTLDRLEKEIRQRAGQDGSVAPGVVGQLTPSADPSVPSAEAPAPPAGVKDARGAPYLGAVVDDRNERGRGLRVVGVRPGSAADRAGLRQQDLITHAASARLQKLSDLSAILALLAPGDKLMLEIMRAGKAKKLEVTLGQRSSPTGAPPRGAEVVAAPPAKPIPPPPPAMPPGTTPLTGPELLPPAVADRAGVAAASEDRLERLQRRVEQLERRVQELEKAATETRKKP
jgi:hypothetical protein